MGPLLIPLAELAGNVALWELITKAVPAAAKYVLGRGAKEIGQGLAKKAAARSIIGAADAGLAAQTPRLGSTVANWIGQTPVSSTIGKVVPAAATLGTVGLAMHGTDAIMDMFRGETVPMSRIEDLPASDAMTVSGDDQRRQVGAMLDQAAMRELLRVVEDYQNGALSQGRII